MRERLDMLVEFAEDLSFDVPTSIVSDPEAALLMLHRFLVGQSVDEEDFSWIVSRLAAFVGELLVYRLGGHWLLCAQTESRFSGRYVVDVLVPGERRAVLVDPFEVAATFVLQPPPRSLVDHLAGVMLEITSAPPTPND
jgi:hypothetical protein